MMDFEAGGQTNQGSLLHAELWPPLWMIFSKCFVLGVMIRLSLLMKGDLAGLQMVTLTLEKRTCGKPADNNMLLCVLSLLEHTNVTIRYDIEALCDSCRRSLDFERPTYTNLNRVLAQVFSSLAALLQFDGVLSVDITEFQTNLVPYPSGGEHDFRTTGAISVKNFHCNPALRLIECRQKAVDSHDFNQTAGFDNMDVSVMGSSYNIYSNGTAAPDLAMSMSKENQQQCTFESNSSDPSKASNEDNHYSNSSACVPGVRLYRDGSNMHATDNMYDNGSSESCMILGNVYATGAAAAPDLAKTMSNENQQQCSFASSSSTERSIHTKLYSPVIFNTASLRFNNV